MPQQEIEVILARHLSEYLVMPIFIVNPAGEVVSAFTGQATMKDRKSVV